MDLEKTPQVEFWREDFGTDYISRNAATPELVRPRVMMWATLMKRLAHEPPESILEVGANIGLNLRALQQLTPAKLYALEPNAKARNVLIEDRVLPAERTMDGVAGAVPLKDATVDMAFTCGVLIHIHPDQLLASIQEIHRVTKRYIVCVEYFADQPETKCYRGHDERLFKRDFGAFYLDHFPDLRVIDYGFFWNRLTGLDNATWWIFEKNSPCIRTRTS